MDKQRYTDSLMEEVMLEIRDVMEHPTIFGDAQPLTKLEGSNRLEVVKIEIEEEYEIGGEG